MNIFDMLKRLLTFRLHAEDDDAGGGGGSLLEDLAGGDDDTGGDDDGDDAAPGAHVSTFGEDGQVGDRPDWVQEQFWDPDKGFDATKAMKSYGDLRTAFDAKLTEAQQMDKGKGLDAADKYLEDFKAPESTEEFDLSRSGDIDADDPAVKSWAAVAQRHGLSKERFNGILKDYLAEVNQHLPEPVNMEDEYTKLGGKERAKKMAGAMVSDLKAMTDNDDQHALNEQELASLMRYGNNADFISAMSKVVARTRGDTPLGIPTGGVTLDGTPSTAEVHAWQGEMVTEGQYKGQRRYDVDEQWRVKVDKAWEMSAGTGSTRKSSRLPSGAGNA
jgi:hypothetical protein